MKAAKIKRPKKTRSKRAFTCIDWERLEEAWGRPCIPSELAKKANVDARKIRETLDDLPLTRTKAFDIVEATGVPRPLDYLYDVRDGKSKAELKIGASLDGWEVVEFLGGDCVRDISFKVGKVFDDSTKRYGRCKVFDLNFDTESREFIADELVRNPRICHLVERNASFPVLYQHGFSTKDKYWVVENWEDAATLQQSVGSTGIEHEVIPFIAKELAKAIFELNKSGVVVRCLSPKMVCLRSDGSLLLRDFELATFLGPTASGQLGEDRSVYYADEFDLPDVDHRADMFSWAQIVIFCLIGRQPPSRPKPDFYASLPVPKKVAAVLRGCSELNRDFRKWDLSRNKKQFDFSDILSDIKGWV